MAVEMAVGSKENVNPLSYSVVQEWQEVYPVGEDDNKEKSTWEREIPAFVTGGGNRQR